MAGRKKDPNSPYWMQIRHFQKQLIENAIEATGTMAGAAHVLGLSVSYLCTRANWLGCKKPRPDAHNKKPSKYNHKEDWFLKTRRARAQAEVLQKKLDKIKEMADMGVPKEALGDLAASLVGKKNNWRGKRHMTPPPMMAPPDDFKLTTEPPPLSKEKPVNAAEMPIQNRKGFKRRYNGTVVMPDDPDAQEGAPLHHKKAKGYRPGEPAPSKKTVAEKKIQNMLVDNAKDRESSGS